MLDVNKFFDDSQEPQYASVEIKYGQIWFIKNNREFSNNIQAGARPAIIVSNDDNNLHSPTVNVIPLTCQDKKDLPVHTIITSAPYDSVALSEQIFTINKSDLVRCVGVLSKREVRRLKICMMIQLNLL